LNMDTLASLATAHLILRLQPLNRALRAGVENQRIAAARLSRADLSAICVTDEHVKLLLELVDLTQSGTLLASSPAVLTAEELAAEQELRAQALAISAILPLDRLMRDFSLTDFELEAILLCAAPELDPAYERIFAFILDDLNRKFPCVELLISLTASSMEERISRRHVLSAFGQLRRRGILQTIADSPTELRQEFRLSPGIFDYLTGAFASGPGQWTDRFALNVPSDSALPSSVSSDEFRHLCQALEEGRIGVLGIWGPRSHGCEELVSCFAAALHRSIRRLSTLDFEVPGTDPRGFLREQLHVAAGLGAVIWLEHDSVNDSSRVRNLMAIADALTYSPIPVFITSESPWRPVALLRSGKYTEMDLTEPSPEERGKIWSRNFPELAAADIETLAARFSLSGADVRSISDLARIRARISGNGRSEPVDQHLVAACSVVTQRESTHFATVIRPRRQPQDLVLLPHLYQQIMEVAAFYQLGSRVDAEWGFGHLANGSGMKALFTGEPGTGKTLAAEVVAGLLGRVLYKVDLARIVSKWVGETEKNLECAFREAEDSHSVLFFDEAEALFGKRAEVQHGTDRYANLEVSFLLQRLESSRGLVILASNVKDQIDPAFTRRFQIAVHFPKPAAGERLRIWRLAFPASAPLHEGIDFDALSQLDMTGAAIVAAARTAALLAADSSAPKITMRHVIRATARQFRREARVLTPVDLGQYGELLQGAT
jgi:ATPase family associated with various cellular activities (AAA)